MTSFAERECVSIYLRDRAVNAWPDDCPHSLWGFFLWAVFHPWQYHEARGRFYALRDAADAIDNDDHLLSMGKLLASYIKQDEQ